MAQKLKMQGTTDSPSKSGAPSRKVKSWIWRTKSVAPQRCFFFRLAGKAGTWKWPTIPSRNANVAQWNCGFLVWLSGLASRIVFDVFVPRFTLGALLAMGSGPRSVETLGTRKPCEQWLLDSYWLMKNRRLYYPMRGWSWSIIVILIHQAVWNDRGFFEHCAIEHDYVKYVRRILGEFVVRVSLKFDYLEGENKWVQHITVTHRSQVLTNTWKPSWTYLARWVQLGEHHIYLEDSPHLTARWCILWDIQPLSKNLLNHKEQASLKPLKLLVEHHVICQLY